MPQYLSPGVYVEDVPGSPPIAGVGTSTAAFIGFVDQQVVMPAQPGKFKLENGKAIPILYELAKEGAPVLVTNWGQFMNSFGDFQAGNSRLAHAVYGFFHNGGTRCYVARVGKDNDGELNATVVEATLKKCEAIDEIAIVAAPGAAKAAVRKAVIEHCAGMEDRFAIIDGLGAATAATEAA